MVPSRATCTFVPIFTLPAIKLVASGEVGNHCMPVQTYAWFVVVSNQKSPAAFAVGAADPMNENTPPDAGETGNQFEPLLNSSRLKSVLYRRRPARSVGRDAVIPAGIAAAPVWGKGSPIGNAWM